MEVDFETNDIGSDDFEIAPGDIEINKSGPVPGNEKSEGFTGSRFDILGDDDGVTVRENLLFDNSVADDEDYEPNNDVEKDDEGDVEDFSEEDENVDPYMLP
ncbi:hypothetical protein GH714_003118 [Hevea brasiliensis]|uniref:Uncharacterized protein n=1 Tax=Hevea brasiliensis TaxID=3981 RepID=A0A6A6MAE6_HEVBR|nr:hypothetical protein GH714_003118 [Hevea brasiliensis]